MRPFGFATDCDDHVNGAAFHKIMRLRSHNRHSQAIAGSTPREASASPKFLPNLTQLQEATKELPDPEEWGEDNYTHQLLVNNQRKTLEFVRKRITRGSQRPYRWVYEGKILIRKRDIS